MTSPDGGRFSAADSALGYLYQARVALLWSLRRLKASRDFLVYLETLDDVTFETKGGTPAELLQTKHHRSRLASLTDASPDLWKTLRVWFSASASVESSTAFYLLTTSAAPAGSIAARLRPREGRDVEGALAAMASVAGSSVSATNAEAYRAFNRASLAERKKLVDRVFVLDSAPQMADLDAELKADLFWAVSRPHLDAFLERLESWWLRRVLKQLASPGLADRILADEIEAEFSDLQEQFGPEALPIDDDLLAFDLDEETRLAHAGSTFVRQLQIINAGKVRIAAAVRDYYRAFEQRSRWIRNDLLLVGDLSRYERRLVEEWELVFEGVKDELGATAAEDAKQRAAREVLKWAESVSMPIRPKVTAPWVTRGSLHMLADGLRLGWHPEFRDRIAAIVGGTEGLE